MSQTALNKCKQLLEEATSLAYDDDGDHLLERMQSTDAAADVRAVELMDPSSDETTRQQYFCECMQLCEIVAAVFREEANGAISPIQTSLSQMIVAKSEDEEFFTMYVRAVVLRLV